MNPGMEALLLPFASIGGTGLVIGGLVFLRVGAAMMALPGLGEQMIPVRVRLALALVLTITLAPLVAPQLLAALEEGKGPGRLLLSEVVVGLALGLGLRVCLAILQIAAAKAAQATSLAQLLGPGAAPDPMPAIGGVLMTGGLALAFAAGLHVQIIAALAESYRVLPPGVLAGGADLAAWGTQGVARAFALAFALAAPFLVFALLYNAALGAINRAMPQLMVALVGAPALTAGGLALLALAAPRLLQTWHEILAARLADPFGPLP